VLPHTSMCEFPCPQYFLLGSARHMYTFLRCQIDNVAVICQRAQEHIHTGECILTYGYSKIVEQFLKAAGAKRKFQVGGCCRGWRGLCLPVVYALCKVWSATWNVCAWNYLWGVEVCSIFCSSPWFCCRIHRSFGTLVCSRCLCLFSMFLP
jgi:hypothetical protein